MIPIPTQISIPNQTTYEYDKYDIIDFLEYEYINEWLSTIPNNIWEKYKSYISIELCKLKDEKIIKYIIEKIKLNLPNYIVKNFDKINLELLKFCVQNNFEKLKDEIKKYINVYEKIIQVCIFHHDYEFNKYFYENIYFKLEPSQEIIPLKFSNLFGLIKNDYNKDNMFYKKILSIYSKNFETIQDIETLKYYNLKFNNVFTKIKRNNIIFNIKNIIIHDVANKNNNFNNLIEIKNIFGIDITEFINELFCYNKNRMLIETICHHYDIDSILQILNLCDNKTMLIKEFVIDILVYISTRNDDIKNISDVFLIYNYFEYQKNFKFTEQIYSTIIKHIIQRCGIKHYKYSEIIYEFINLGGRVSGYSIYTDYINRIKIKPNQNII